MARERAQQFDAQVALERTHQATKLANAEAQQAEGTDTAAPLVDRTYHVQYCIHHTHLSLSRLGRTQFPESNFTERSIDHRSTPDVNGSIERVSTQGFELACNFVRTRNQWNSRRRDGSWKGK
jgi:hypothetical protein